MILQIGNHQFDVDMSYETLERVSAWEWGEVPIVGDYPILQNVRKSAPTLSFTGIVVQLRSRRRPRAGLGRFGKYRGAAVGHIGSRLFLRVLGNRIVAAERSGLPTGTAFGNQERMDVEPQILREY